MVVFAIRKNKITEAKKRIITYILWKERNFRRKGIASILLKEILKTNRHNSIKVINTEVGCSSITKFLQSNSIFLEGKQFEMIKQL